MQFLKRDLFPAALGTWVLGGCFLGGADEFEIIRTLEYALEQGIEIFDTAPLYGFGKTEEIVGRALKQLPGSPIVCTKFGLGWKGGKIFRDARRETVLKEAEESLRRLQVGRIDLYQLHWPDPATPIEETADALCSLLDQGKIGAVGLSNCTLSELKEMERHIPVDVIQPPFNFFERDAEKDLLPYCHSRGISVLGYGTLCRGLLSGKMGKNPHFRSDDLRSFDPKYKEPLYSRYLACAEELKEWVESRKSSLVDLSFRWAIDKGVIPLWGPANASEIIDCNSIKQLEWSPCDYAEIEAIVARAIPEPVGVEFLAPPVRT